MSDGYWNTGRVSPSDAAIRRWFSQWHVKGMLKTSPQLVDHENIARVRESVLRSPKRSAKKHDMAFKPPTEVCGILHENLKFYPYKNVT